MTAAKVLLFCCLASLVFADEIFTEEQYAELDVLPGLDFVGFGYDARFDTASAALQVPVMEFSFSKAKSFAYPTLRELSFKVPDEIYVRNVAFTEAQAYLYNSLTEYKSKLALDIGINYEQLTGTYASNQTCVSANNTAPNCTTTGTSSNEQVFSIGATVGFVKESFKSVESYLVENSEKTQLYHIFLDSRFIRPEVKEDLRVLSNFLFDDNRPLYIKFLEKYGTHYVVSATMGGQVTMMSSIAKSLTTDSTTTSAGASAGQSSSQSLSQSDALASASKTFATSLNSKLDFSFSTVNTNIELQSTSQWRLLGGNSSIVNLLDSRNSSAAIRTWKETITSNPVPVGYRLREITTLFDDPTMRQQLAAAVDAYLHIDTSDILQLENWVPLPKPAKRSANPVMELWEDYQVKLKERAEREKEELPEVKEAVQVAV